jgi:hypothetical protein
MNAPGRRKPRGLAGTGGAFRYDDGSRHGTGQGGFVKAQRSVKRQDPGQEAGPAMKWTVTEDPSGDQLLALLPLGGEVSRAIAAELIRDGFGDQCGECGKPFNAVRKRRGIGRVSHVDLSGGIYTTTWLLCGRCTAEMKRNGNRVSHKLIAEARSATEAGLLLAARPRGSA